ncbi:MAG: hypothetical protein R2991_13815 [Thermoanaerobaculia bacterium]
MDALVRTGMGRPSGGGRLVGGGQGAPPGREEPPLRPRGRPGGARALPVEDRALAADLARMGESLTASGDAAPDAEMEDLLRDLGYLD